MKRTIFKLNFDKLYIYEKSKILKGINVVNNQNDIIINEEIEHPIIQIIFMLRESFHENSKFKGWQDFTRDYLLKLIHDQESIYLSNYQSGNNFIKKLYGNVDYFLNTFCDYKIIDNLDKNIIKDISLMSIKQRQQQGILYFIKD